MEEKKIDKLLDKLKSLDKNIGRKYCSITTFIFNILIICILLSSLYIAYSLYIKYTLYYYPGVNCIEDFYNCSDFWSWYDAQNMFNSCYGDPSKLDQNNNGVACESRFNFEDHTVNRIINFYEANKQKLIEKERIRRTITDKYTTRPTATPEFDEYMFMPK